MKNPVLKLKNVTVISLLIFVNLFAYNQDTLTVFNPATYNSAGLPSNMSIVEKDENTYLQVVLDFWNNYLYFDSYIKFGGTNRV